MAGSKGGNAVPFLYKILLAFFVILSLILIIVLITEKAKDKTCDEARKISSENYICQSDLKQETERDGPPSVFEDLSEDEINAVQQYMLSVNEFNPTLYSKAKTTDNFILSIENYLPSKSDVLSHLDEQAAQPGRIARVIIVNGKKSAPDIEEYLVYTLPKPKSHSRLKMGGYKYPSPYSGLGWNLKDDPYFHEIAMNISIRAEEILMESFGETLHKCNPGCLNAAPYGFPASFKKGVRQTWVGLQRTVEGIYYYFLPFEIRVDHSGTDASKYRANLIIYNNQSFDTVEGLVSKYRQGLVKKIQIKKPDNETVLRSSLRLRKGMKKFKPLQAPKLVEPSGKRYSIKGNQIKYFDWQFDISVKPSNGIGIYDIRYNGKRIIYELSVQDLYVTYSGAGGQQSCASYFDTSVGVGAYTFELVKGIDCPDTASYMDANVFLQTDKVEKKKNAICVFEYDTGIPIRRHKEFKWSPETKQWFFGGVQGKALMIRMIATPVNYDYIFDFIFHPNGVIETRTSASGYLQTTSFMDSETDYGFQTFENDIGTIHDHFLLYKIDLDIDGVKNSYQTVDVVPKNMSYRWEPGTYRYGKTIQRNKKKSEKEAVLHYNFDKPKYMVMQNDNSKNRFGNPKGYRIIPQGMVKQTFPDDYPSTKAASWTKHQLAITRYKDNERFGYCVYNQHGMEDPTFSFDKIINDDDNIINEDLVAWVTVGGLHIPNTEDVPNTFTMGNSYSFLLKPYGYFEEEQSVFSRDSVFIGSDADGKTKRMEGIDDARETCNA